MLNAITFNSLACDKPEIFPFPEEVKPLVQKTDWNDFVWNTAGLPVNGGHYSLVNGSELYLDALPNGEAKVQKEDFTGEILAVNYFVSPETDGWNYLVKFKLIFLKGALVEVLFDSSEKQEYKVYSDGLAKYTNDFHKVLKRQTSWWYRFLYKPYRITVRCIALVLVWILSLVKDLIVKLTLFLTPI